MNLIGFNEYEDSGHNFIEQKPKGWKSIRVKDLILKVGSGVTPKGGSEVYLDSGIPLLRSQNVYNDGLRISEVSFIDEETDKKMRNSRVKPFDLLINITGASIGRTCIVPQSLKKANINQHVLYLRMKKKKVDFISYYFKSQFLKDYIMMIQAGSSKEALTMGQALNIPVICPSNYEQTQIANYLDKKTVAIDKKVELLAKKASYYKELRKSLINETVCRGLNKSVKLVDSGVDWIGKIPEHWEMFRLKDIGRLYSGLSGKSGNDFNQDDNPNNKGFIPFTNIANNTYLNPDNLGTVVISKEERQNKVKKGDLFFLMSSEGYEDIGKSALLTDEIPETYLNSFCKGFRLKGNADIHPQFLNYLLLSDTYRHILIVEGKGFTRINLKMEKVTDFQVFIPSKSEQIEIADYIDSKTATIDQIITNINSQILTLKELRKTLINDVVTGKVRVSEVVEENALN